MASPMYMGDTDSEDEIPTGWEERADPEGRVYYADHVNQKTQWTHPKTGKRKFVPEDLPFGWVEKTNDDDGSIYWLEEKSGKTTKSDPRLAFIRDSKTSLYDFKQRFDASTTARQVLNGVNLTNKRALITGCNSGIGLETAKSLALSGCEILLGCRDQKRAEEAIELIRLERPEANLTFIQMDFCSLKSVKDAANEIRLKYRSIDILILNAGIFGASFELTEDNFEKTYQVNHLSQFYLTILLKPLLIASSNAARIIFVASESHRFSLMTSDNIDDDYLSPKTSRNHYPFLAYNDSKLCNVLIANEIHRRWCIHGVTCNSLHPGNMVSSGLSRNWWFYRMLFFMLRPFTKSLQQASATTVWGATAYELNGVGGVYLNNCWLNNPIEKSQDVEFARLLWTISTRQIEKVVGPISGGAAGIGVLDEPDYHLKLLN